jgi:thymidylate synthase (FAD)
MLFPEVGKTKQHNFKGIGGGMKIIKQSHEIIGLPVNAIQMIEKAGRTCYKSEDNIASDSAKGFVKTLIDRGHYAMLEFGDITVRFITNRGVTHELVRHRLFSFAQESTRYVRYDGQMEFIQPVWCSDKVLGTHTIEWRQIIGTRAEGQINPELSPGENVWFWNQAIAERDYCNLLDCGWRPEQAREVLPNSLKTEIIVKGNIREWRHCLTLRTSRKAHPQMRALMTPLLNELQGKAPVIFDDINK